ncbi:putative aminotransferase [Pyrococcus sp. NA2]|uniref:aminotransferase class I/II-fold pyridoxal phosphate-dependent enzyme n=1 Tax=Pyrococcus sp. (strain NA2) TaxID=342949 RepID=UPI000209A99D|nr:aminotransferase class I/II-fold pyridoxal phosphate-dependent enzyme [Pyrococcus sp. NA2]AEC51915.1 putative aminotransferase [Pyrococcus sp. NA2]
MLEPLRFSTHHGGARRRERLLDFSASLNPYPPEWIGEVFERAKELSQRYPYYEDLEEELSQLVGDEITVTAGITEALYLVGILALRRDKKVVIPRHTFGEYERVARMFNARVVKGPNEPERLAELVDRNSVVFFCNPNNPDGKFYDVRPLIDVVEDTNSLLVLDEAFIDFVRGAKSYESENVVKLRTFTKSYGVPGIRVGYVIGFSEAFRSVRMPWGIGSLGVAFLEKVVEDKFDHIRKTMPLIWKEKERIERRLNLKSDANYFVMEVGDARTVVEKLRELGILVRDCSSFGLPRHIRFSVRKPEENDALLEALEKVLDV